MSVSRLSGQPEARSAARLLPTSTPRAFLAARKRSWQESAGSNDSSSGDEIDLIGAPRIRKKARSEREQRGSEAGSSEIWHSCTDGEEVAVRVGRDDHLTAAAYEETRMAPEEGEVLENYSHSESEMSVDGVELDDLSTTPGSPSYQVISDSEDDVPELSSTVSHALLNIVDPSVDEGVEMHKEGTGKDVDREELYWDGLPVNGFIIPTGSLPPRSSSSAPITLDMHPTQPPPKNEEGKSDDVHNVFHREQVSISSAVVHLNTNDSGPAANVPSPLLPSNVADNTIYKIMAVVAGTAPLLIDHWARSR